MSDDMMVEEIKALGIKVDKCLAAVTEQVTVCRAARAALAKHNRILVGSNGSPNLPERVRDNREAIASCREEIATVRSRLWKMAALALSLVSTAVAKAFGWI